MTFSIPSDPLARFRAIYDELNLRRSWTQGAMPLRHAAVTLVTTEGAPYAIADRVYSLAAELKQSAGWFGALTSPVRFQIAAMLLQRDETAADFTREVDRVSSMLRAQGMRRGSMYEVLAILVLRARGDRRRIEQADVEQFHKVYEVMKRHHWWLTGPDDYPACALLTRSTDSVAEMARRIENLYQRLRDAGMAAGDPLQLASHVLYFNTAPEREVAQRFLALADAVRRAGIRVWQSDYDELAILTFLDRPAEQLAARVVQHRAAMRSLRPRPNYNETFSLACSITNLEALRSMADAMDTRAIAEVHTIVEVQQSIAAIAAANAQAAAAAGAA